jgi:GT2 family glycosyltransferase
MLKDVSEPLVSIIIVNYKDYDYLYNCLISLSKTMYPKIEIIVIDNESDLNALNKVKSEFKEVCFFPLKENWDYASGNNYGIDKSKGDFVVLLNNDTIVDNNWLGPLVREALIRPRAFYQPKILLLDKHDTISSLGNTVNIFGFAFPIGNGKCVSEIALPKEKVEVFYCSGACVLTSREILNEFGGLDPNYWKYYEDVNLGWKGRLCGYPSYLVPNSTIYHKWGGTFGQQLSSKKLYLLERGRISSILRNFLLGSIIFLFPAILILDLIIMIYLVPKGMATVKIHASIDVLRNLGVIIRERRKIQAARIKTDKEISLYMSHSIEHPYIGRIPHRVEGLLVQISRWLMKML